MKMKLLQRVKLLPHSERAARGIIYLNGRGSSGRVRQVVPEKCSAHPSNKRPGDFGNPIDQRDIHLESVCILFRPSHETMRTVAKVLVNAEIVHVKVLELDFSGNRDFEIQTVYSTVQYSMIYTP